MNRENKRKQFEKSYHKFNACDDLFTCKNCGRIVVETGAGTNHRNHCPYCLTSQHLDNEPGDRQADCGGIMEPVAVWIRKNGEWALSTVAKFAANCTQTELPPISKSLQPARSLLH